MCKTGFDGLSLSGCGLGFKDGFPLTLSLSKGERVFIDTPSDATADARYISQR